ncbi:MAG: beta-methylgalactoside transporter [Ruthenibacterium sp.]
MEATKKLNAKSVKSFLGNNAIIILLVLIAIGVGIARPSFFSWANFINLMKNTSIRYILALGISGCLITTGNDVSAGRTAGFAACIAAILLQRGDYSDKFYPNLPELPIWLVLIIVVGICALVGLANGLVVSYLRVQPFIATLGMQTIVYGICLVYTGAIPIGGLRSDFTNLANGGFFGGKFSYVFIFALVIFVFMWFLYNKTRHGKYMYAIGGNEVAAEVAGVNVPRTKIKIYMLASSLFAVAGFLMAAKSGGASVNTAQGYELDAIAACTIGGVSTTGGIGKVSGVFVGVLVFELLKIAMQFLGIETSYTYIVQGLVIIVAVAMDIRKYLAKK